MTRLGCCMVYAPNDELTSLCVDDLGDLKFNRGLKTYFLDLFFGDYKDYADYNGPG